MQTPVAMMADHQTGTARFNHQAISRERGVKISPATPVRPRFEQGRTRLFANPAQERRPALMRLEIAGSAARWRVRTTGVIRPDQTMFDFQFGAARLQPVVIVK